jgi:hypothetical protein
MMDAEARKGGPFQAISSSTKPFFGRSARQTESGRDAGRRSVPAVSSKLVYRADS